MFSKYLALLSIASITLATIPAGPIVKSVSERSSDEPAVPLELGEDLSLLVKRQRSIKKKNAGANRNGINRINQRETQDDTVLASEVSKRQQGRPANNKSQAGAGENRNDANHTNQRDSDSPEDKSPIAVSKRQRGRGANPGASRNSAPIPGANSPNNNNIGINRIVNKRESKEAEVKAATDASEVLVRRQRGRPAKGAARPNNPPPAGAGGRGAAAGGVRGANVGPGAARPNTNGSDGNNVAANNNNANRVANANRPPNRAN